MKKSLSLILALLFFLPLLSCGQSGTGTVEEARGWYPYDLSQYVELIDWHGVEAEFDDPDVCTEEEIDEAILQVMLTYAAFEEKEGPAELYDAVLCDVYVYFGEELLEDQSMEDHEIILGQSSLDDMDRALAEQLIGCVPEDLCYAEYTYPESTYLYGEMAGKTMKLVAEVKTVYGSDIPVCDDEFVQGLSDYGFKTVADFRQAVRQDVLDQKKENRVYAVWKAFYAAARVLQYPEFEVRQYRDDYLAYYREYAEEYDLDLDEFLQEYFNASLADFEAEAKEYAESTVKNDMIFTQLSRLMGTTLSEEEYREGVEAYYEKESTQYDTLEAFIEHYGEDVLRENLIWDKSLRAMAEQAVRVEPAAN